MQVETYEAISLDQNQNDEIVNELVSEEAMALVESLNLVGQKSLLSEVKVGGETVTVRNPYRLMTAEETAIFSAVLPQQIHVQKYSDGPIPLRALQVAAHALALYHDVQVWCPASRTDPDPLLVAIDGARGDRKVYILARWGEILEPLDVLREKARTLVLARARRDIATARAKIGKFEAILDENIEAYLRGGETDTEWLPSLSLVPR